MVKVEDSSIYSAFKDSTKIFQEKVYDHSFNGEWISDPYIGFRLKKLEKKIDNELILKSNSLGLRAEELEKNSNYDALFLGGSLIFGSYSSTQNTTISEFYSKTTREKILNGGIGGHVLKQHISLFNNYLSNSTFKKIFLVFGFNDMSNCFQGKNYDDIRLDIFHKKINKIYQNPIKESLKIIFFKVLDYLKLSNQKKFLINYYKKNIDNENNNSINFSIDSIKKYCDDIYKNLINFSNLCKIKNIKLHVILQPSLLTSSKEKSPYEKAYLKNNLTEKKINFNKLFFKELNDKLRIIENYYNFEDIYNSEKKTIFIDEAHVGDIGNKIFAEKLITRVNNKF